MNPGATTRPAHSMITPVVRMARGEIRAIIPDRMRRFAVYGAEPDPSTMSPPFKSMSGSLPAPVCAIGIANLYHRPEN